MEDKNLLQPDQLEKVSGGTGENYDTGRKCLQCGSTRVRFTGERGDMGAFTCDDCGSTFYGDV